MHIIIYIPILKLFRIIIQLCALKYASRDAIDHSSKTLIISMFWISESKETIKMASKYARSEICRYYEYGYMCLYTITYGNKYCKNSNTYQINPICFLFHLR